LGGATMLRLHRLQPRLYDLRRHGALVATYLVSATGSAAAPAIYLIVVALLVLPVVYLLPETRGLSLLREGEGRPEVGPDATGAQPS
jgi:hypothetical protein